MTVILSCYNCGSNKHKIIVTHTFLFRIYWFVTKSTLYICLLVYPNGPFYLPLGSYLQQSLNCLSMSIPGSYPQRNTVRYIGVHDMHGRMHPNLHTFIDLRTVMPHPHCHAFTAGHVMAHGCPMGCLTWSRDP